MVIQFMTFCQSFSQFISKSLLTSDLKIEFMEKPKGHVDTCFKAVNERHFYEYTIPMAEIHLERLIQNPKHLKIM